MKPIFQLSGNSRVISVNVFEVGTGLLVAGGIRDDGFTAGEIGELEADFEKGERHGSAMTEHTTGDAHMAKLIA